MTGTTIYIKRAVDRNLSVIPQLGETVYCISTKELYVGDGKTPLCELQPITMLNNIVTSPVGQLWNVTVDNCGNCEAKKLICHTNNFFGFDYYSSKQPQRMHKECCLSIPPELISKFRVNDKVVLNNSPHVYRFITSVLEDGTYVLDGEIYGVKENEIELYIEQK